MKKEVIIVIIILALIIILNTITQKYTNEKMTEVSENLTYLKAEVINEDKEKAKEKFEEILEKWDNVKMKFVIYIEHNELEKVEMYLTEIGSHIETKEYSMAIESIDVCNFIIEHIKDKYKFSLKNIF